MKRSKQDIINNQEEIIRRSEQLRTELQRKLTVAEGRLEERHTQAVGQILQSMAAMMESATRVVLSLHRNL